MNAIQKLIRSLQEKSYETRTRILWGSSTIIGVIVVSIWFANLKKDIRNFSVSSVTTANQTQISAQHYLNVSAYEQKDKQILLYFSVKNDTADILNFSKVDDITLRIDDKEFKPSKITDRTRGAFVQKALSGTENFGIAIFDNVEGKKGTLTFDNLFFEQSSDTIFREVIDINLNDLGKPIELGN